MKLAFVAVLLFLCINPSFAQLCNFEGKDSLYVSFSGDMVEIWDLAACSYCSSVFDFAVTTSADSISIIQTDTVFAKTLCDCTFDLKTGIIGLSPGTYWVVIYRDQLLKYGYSREVRDSIGSIQITIPSSGQSNFLFTKYQSGCTSKAAVEEQPSLPTRFALLQNYPNPFNPATTIRYSLAGDAHVSLKLFNVLGQLAATLVDEFQQAGYKSVPFNAEHLPSGVYFYRLQAGNYTSVKKMLLMK